MLSEFDERLLYFVYWLSLSRRPLSHAAIARELRLPNGRNVTARTIGNWFRYMKQPYVFKDLRSERRLSYYPGFRESMLGLALVCVFFENPTPEIVGLFPNKAFAAWLRSADTLTPTLDIEYHVPPASLGGFLRVLQYMVDNGLCDAAQAQVSYPSFRIMSPLHEVMDKQGFFHPERNSTAAADLHLTRFAEHLRVVRNNPPLFNLRSFPGTPFVVAEYRFELRSSREVWLAVKSRLRDEVWNCFSIPEHSNDVRGASEVRRVIRALSAHGVISQMRAVYFPIEMGRPLTLYVVVPFKSQSDMLYLVRVALLNSIFINAHLLHGNRLLIKAISSDEGVGRLLHSIEGYTIEKLWFVDYRRSGRLITSAEPVIPNYCEFYDPVCGEWNLDVDDLKERVGTVASAKSA